MKKYLFITGIWLVVVLLLFVVQKRWWLRPDFVDEQDNFVTGSMLVSGEKLYKNTFSHHQPIAYMISGVVEKIIKPGNIFVLVKYHRMFIFGWSMLWWLALIWFHGWWMFLPMLVLETIKIIYLGNLFLAESIVLLPTIFLGLSLIDKRKDSNLKALVLGITTAFVGLTLASLWLFLIFLTLVKWKRWKDKKIFFMLAGMIVVAGIVMTNIDLVSYWKNAIVVNQKYYLPVASTLPIYKSIAASFLTPINYILVRGTVEELRIVKLVIWVFLIMNIFMFKKNKKTLGLVLISLALVNTRNFEMGKTHYDGFHLIMWVGLVITYTVWLMSVARKKMLWVIGLILLIVTGVTINKQIREKDDLRDDFEIYYSRIFNMTEAIKASAGKNDKLLSMPDEVLGYWKTGVFPASKYTFFYKWMVGVDFMKNEQIKTFEQEPEYLIIGSNEGLGLEKYFNKYQQFNYRGGRSELLIKLSKWNSLDSKVKKQVNYFGFEPVND